MNNVVLVGRLTRDVEVKETESGKKVSTVCLAVSRPYKNVEGVYETDFINCILWNGVAENTSAYCKKGDVVCIKGRIEISTYEKDNEKRYVTNVIAEKVNFISSVKKEADE